MIYSVYNDNGILKVKSKGLVKKLGYKTLIEFNNFYDATDWIHENINIIMN